MPTIIYGPAGSGKTHNAEAFRLGFGRKRIVDGWSPDDPRPLRIDDLILTNVPPPYGSELVGASIYPIDRALKMIGRRAGEQ